MTQRLRISKFIPGSIYVAAGLWLFSSCGDHAPAKEAATTSATTVTAPAANGTAPANQQAPVPSATSTPPVAADGTIKSYHVSLGWPVNTTLKNSIVLTTGETFTLNDAANHAGQIDVITEARSGRNAGLFAPTSLESTQGWSRRRGSRVSSDITGYTRAAFDAIGNAQQVHAIGAANEPGDEKTELQEGHFYIAKTFEGKYAIIAVTKAIGNPSDPMSTVDLDIKCEQ